MRKSVYAILVLALFTNQSFAQLKYLLTYTDTGLSRLHVEIQLNQPVLSQSLAFVMPRCIPGSYSLQWYDRFVEEVEAMDIKDQVLKMHKNPDDAPRWELADSNIAIKAIHYAVNIAEMERAITALSDISVLRKEYAGLLNYTIFGWIAGTEEQPVLCTIQTNSNWQIYSTLAPKESPDKGNYTFTAGNYYILADGQTLLGNFRVKKFNGLVPVYVVNYSETKPAYLDDFGWFGTNSLAILNDYYGSIPFDHYTIFTEYIIPVDKNHNGNFAMEHLASATFFSDTSGIPVSPWPENIRLLRNLPVLHHMAHAWLPLRCYGDNYLPHVSELPVIMRTIWFNEGFTWFLCLDTLKNKRIRDFLIASVYKTAPAIKKLSLVDLSQIASVSYADDFRLGRACLGRGALMADEMNTLIKRQTHNTKSMKQVLRYLYEWMQKNKRPFTMDELPGLIRKASGIDVSFVYRKWLQPIE